MRILLDEDVHARVLDWLVKQGHSVVRVSSGLKNGQVVELARQESRALISRDKDFANRLMYPPEKSAGIVVLRIHPPQKDTIFLLDLAEGARSSRPLPTTRRPEGARRALP